MKEKAEEQHERAKEQRWDNLHNRIHNAAGNGKYGIWEVVNEDGSIEGLPNVEEIKCHLISLGYEVKDYVHSGTDQRRLEIEWK